LRPASRRTRRRGSASRARRLEPRRVGGGSPPERRALALAGTVGDEWLIGVVLNNLGNDALCEAAFERAASLFGEALDFGTARGDLDRIARAAINLGSALLALGDRAALVRPSAAVCVWAGSS